MNIVKLVDIYDSIVYSHPDLRRLYPLPLEALYIKENWRDIEDDDRYYIPLDLEKTISHIINEVKHHQGEYQA